MKILPILGLLFVLPVMAQDVAELSLSDVESRLDERYHEISESTETHALIQATADAKIRYHQALTKNPEIQALEAEFEVLQARVAEVSEARIAKEKELQLKDQEVRDAKNALDEAKRAAEAVYETSEIKAMEVRRSELLVEKMLVTKQE